MRKLLLLLALILNLHHAGADTFTDQGLVYSYDEGGSTVSVISVEDGVTDVQIPESVWYNDRLYTVVAIADDAFKNSAIQFLSIANSVTSIGDRAFMNCSSLRFIYNYGSLTYLGERAFQGCTSLIQVLLPSTLTEVKDFTFAGCTGLKTLSLGNVTTLGNRAVENCTSLSTLALSERLKAIPYGAFTNCDSLTNIVLPDSLTTIGYRAFYDCSSLEQVTVGKCVTDFGKEAFYNCDKLHKVIIENDSLAIRTTWVNSTSGSYLSNTIQLAFDYKNHDINFYVNRDSYTTIFFWENKLIPYDASNSESLLPPTVSLTVSPGVIKGKVENNYPEFSVRNVNVESLGFYLDNDNGFTYKGTESGETLAIGLNLVKTSDMGKSQYYYYTIPYDSVRTEDIIMETLTPRVVKRGKVIFSARTNITEEYDLASMSNLTSSSEYYGSYVGFMYLHEDEELDENVVNEKYTYSHNCFYNQAMENCVELDPQYKWKYRAVYRSYYHTNIYGEWITVDPTDITTAEPVVQTYNQSSIDGNTADIKGFALTGSDDITSQGFYYWNTSANKASSKGMKRAAAIPDTAQKIEVSGSSQLMQATLSGLDYNSTYVYVAFVTTSEGDTYYGDERTFETGAAPTGIDEIRTSCNSDAKCPAGIYDLNGRKLGKMRRGINIVRYEDGSIKKVVIK